MFFSRKKILAVAFTGLSIVGYGVFVFAAAPSGGYNPGQTLDPTCAPGATDCDVKPSAMWGNITGTLADQSDLQAALNSKLSTFTVSVPLHYSSNIVSISQAGNSADGYLSSTDWNTFNGKLATVATDETTITGDGTLGNPLAAAPLNWSLTGNANTTYGTDFIGTTNNVDLQFQVNSQIAGFVQNNNANTALGYQSGAALTNGTGNSFFGNIAGQNDTTGSHNTFVGIAAGYTNVGGSDNLIIGNASDVASSSTNGAIAIGYGAIASSNSIALGDSATNTLSNQFLISSSYNNIDIAGVNYVFPGPGTIANGSALISDHLGNLSWQIPTAAAGGNDQAIQFNNGGLVSGTNNLTWNGASLNVHASDGFYVTAPSNSSDGFHFITSDLRPNVPEVDFDVGGRKALFGYDGNVGRATFYSDGYSGGVYIYNTQGIAIGTNPLAYSGNALYIEQPVHGPTSQVYTGSGVKFGVGVTPTDDLTVSDTSITTAVAAFTNFNGTCEISPTTSSLSCSSDQRLKKNIADISSTTALSQVLQLQAVTFNWNAESDSTAQHIGFIAQQVQQIFPQFVTTDSNGYLGVSYGSFAPVLAESIKALNLKITDIQNFAAATDTTFLTNLENWLASATNGIKQIYADTFTGKEVDTNTLCVTDATGAKTCITKSQLDQLLGGQGSSSAGGGSTPVVTTTVTTTSTTDSSSTGASATSSTTGTAGTSSSTSTPSVTDSGATTTSSATITPAVDASAIAPTTPNPSPVVSTPAPSSPDTSVPAATGSTDSISVPAPAAPTAPVGN